MYIEKRCFVFIFFCPPALYCTKAYKPPAEFTFTSSGALPFAFRSFFVRALRSLRTYGAPYRAHLNLDFFITIC